MARDTNGFGIIVSRLRCLSGGDPILVRWARWLVGLGLDAWTHPNFIIWLVLIVSLPRVFSLFHKRTEEEQRFYEIKPAQRWTMAAMYFGLIAALVVGMHVALAQLQVTASIRKRGHRCNKRRSGTSR